MAECSSIGSQPYPDEDFSYNSCFSLDDINRACIRLKNNKATGFDMLPNEVLKHDGIRLIILHFMNKCFESHVIPGAWKQAIISPIPKSATKDPFKL